MYCYDDTNIKSKCGGNNANHLLFSFGSCLHVSPSSSFNLLLTGCFFCRPYSWTYSSISFHFWSTCFLLNSHRAYLVCLLCFKWSPFKKVIAGAEEDQRLHNGPEELSWKGKEKQARLTWHSLREQDATAEAKHSKPGAPTRAGESWDQKADLWLLFRGDGKGQEYSDRNMQNFMPPRNQCGCCTENKRRTKTHFSRTQLAKGRIFKEN